MSFLSEIVNRKNKLQETETKVTSADGNIHIERRVGQKIVKVESGERSCGFVVDTKPDNIPVLVSEHLYIGSQDCADPDILKKYNIQNVLSLGVESIVNVNYKHIYCLDIPETDITPVLEVGIPFIKRAIDGEENVLVHCNAGVSRAAMIVIAYLIVQEKYCYEDAYKMLKDKRPAVQPNAGFVRQLKLLK